MTNSSDQIDSSAKVKVSPKFGNARSSSNITTDPFFAGTITNVDPNDTVTIGHDSGTQNFEVLIYGTGGTVNVASDTIGTVVNRASLR